MMLITSVTFFATAVLASIIASLPPADVSQPWHRQPARLTEGIGIINKRSHPTGSKEHELKLRRQSAPPNGRCGLEYGSCAAGYCCSADGYCGQGQNFCRAPLCQFRYGPACDDNVVPPGANTSSVLRPRTSSIAYGLPYIYHCTVPGTVALTFDDGPYIYTNDILDTLRRYQAKATFFVTGNNNGKGQIDNAANPWAAMINRMHNEGHQIASHTWSHQSLSSLTSAERKQNMWSNEMALRNVLGFFPTYMRPPYVDCSAASGCSADLADLGYHVIYFDVDTADYRNSNPILIQNSKDAFANALSGGNPMTDSFLVIAHDIHEQTVYNLTGFMLDTLLSKGYRPVTVGECLGDPVENWYISSSSSTFVSAGPSIPSPSRAVDSPAASSAAATPVTVNAKCGVLSGHTCLGSSFGDWCSKYSFCGSTDAYCGSGCQPRYGAWAISCLSCVNHRNSAAWGKGITSEGDFWHSLQALPKVAFSLVDLGGLKEAILFANGPRT